MKSDNAKKGLEKAPHRSLFRALGLTDEEVARPIIGIVNSKNDIVPGHMNLDKIGEAVKAGVCDGIAMNHQGMKYSLGSREIIADSVEIMATAHAFDGLVFIPNCDKIVPGMLMAAARLNLPCIFISGGPMLAGNFKGSCSGMFTANSMNCLTEALGMGLPGNGTIPAVYSERIRLAKQAGMKIMELVEKEIKPADIMTTKAFENAMRLDMAIGCSTNSVLSGRRPSYGRLVPGWWNSCYV